MTQNFMLRILFCALLLGTVNCSAKSEEPPKPKPESGLAAEGELRCISFNVRRQGSETNDQDRWEVRRYAVVKMIEQEKPSIMGIQEGKIEQVRWIEESCSEYARFGVGRNDGNESGEMMAVFYRRELYEKLESGTFWLSETPDVPSTGWDTKIYRSTTWLRMKEKATGKEFYFIDTHFDHKGEIARRESALLVAAWIEENVPDGMTVILCGDFNSNTDDPIFDPLKKILLVARDVAPVTDYEGTFNGFGTVDDVRILDHFFFRKAEALSLKVLRNDYGADYISDHYPVVFHCRLP